MAYLIFAILMFGVLIFIHELGHFLVARACGVRVNEFSLGMGPTIWKKQGKSTVYSLRAFPVGGFCAMEGEDSDNGDPASFGQQSGWKKFLILAAGPAMNFCLGVLVVMLLFTQSTAFAVPTLAGLQEGCPSGEALQAGDELLRVNGHRVLMTNDIALLLSRGAEDRADFVVRRGGAVLNLNDVPCYVKEYTVEGGTVRNYGFLLNVAEANPLNRFTMALRQSADFVRLIWFSLEDMFSGAVGVRDLSGPIGIVSTMSDVGEASASAGEALLDLLYFSAFISVNLAVMNLLPLPALDGGRIFFLLINGLCCLLVRRRIPARYEGYVHTAGFVLLLGLMVVVAFSDVMRLAGA